jgi:hypothetical protein
MLRGVPEAVPLVLFVVLAALFAVFGLFFVLRPDRAAIFFADERSRGRFRPRDARAVGAVFVIGGGVLAAVGIVRLLAVVTAG